MIALNNISLRFGNFELFSDVGFMVNERDRVGLVGKNGAGKTTILKILCGLTAPTTGTVSVPASVSLGYLPQHLRIYDNSRTVYEEAATAFSEIKALELELEALNHEVAVRTDYHSDDYAKLLEKLSQVSDRFHLLSTDNIESGITRTLKGLGFTDSDMVRMTGEFSGGWRMRIELAKILLRAPDVLLLDEPTNHLDIIAIQWLEEFLKEYRGAVVLISHDRTFLDNVTQRTIEISLGRIYDYKVPYSKFVGLREERLIQQKATWENQQKLIAETEKFIERFRYKASKANQVQSRIKQLEKIEPVVFDEIDTRSIHFRFPPAPRSGTIIVETSGLSKAYGDNIILEDIDFVAERGDKIALVGKNGEGKTTFARIIAGVLDYTGNLKVGHNVNIGYYAQNQEELLNEELTVYDTLDQVAVGDVRQRLREILGSFLFSGEDIDKKVKVLSGGEKSRLALARLILEPRNLLILDEPTNHLDLKSKEILQEALIRYDGSLILVSHDRYFLNGLVNKVYEVKGRKLKEETGGIDHYIARYRKQILQQLSLSQPAPAVKNRDTSNDSKQEYLDKKEYDRNLRRLRKEVENHEKAISELETSMELLEQEINKMHSGENIDDRVYANYQDARRQLDQQMHLWEVACEKLQEFEGKT